MSAANPEINLKKGDTDKVGIQVFQTVNNVLTPIDLTNYDSIIFTADDENPLHAFSITCEKGYIDPVDSTVYLAALGWITVPFTDVETANISIYKCDVVSHWTEEGVDRSVRSPSAGSFIYMQIWEAAGST